RPPYGVISGFLKKAWGQFGIDKILMNNDGTIIVRFNSVEARNSVLEIGVFHFDRKPMILAPWSGKPMSRGQLDRVPIWIQLTDLSMRFWGASALSKIASLIGLPIMVDKVTQDRNRSNFARVLVEVDPSILPDEVFFEDDNGNVITQKVTYEWKPVLCGKCTMYGHDSKMCRKNTKKEEVLLL
ncbi:MAG: DUF4283 domain-containing protein, partial [Sweet potato little leaf phytoplasma]|nr:DUF4283 domain-containing protein [Sweet potato little leaf phytoplasma]